jgi:hypothetical protein
LKISKRASLIVSILTLTMLFVSFASAQYATQQTSNFFLDSNGKAHIDQGSSTGVIIDILGTPYANGSVSIGTYSGNPYPDAGLSCGGAVRKFFVVSFNISASDFISAKLTFPYTDADLEGTVPPYAIFKYYPENNTYVEIATIIANVAHTMSITIYSPTDPVFAIGAEGVSTPTPTGGPGSFLVSAWAWIAIVAAIVAIVLGVALTLRRKQLASAN